MRLKQGGHGSFRSLTVSEVEIRWVLNIFGLIDEKISLSDRRGRRFFRRYVKLKLAGSISLSGSSSGSQQLQIKPEFWPAVSLFNTPSCWAVAVPPDQPAAALLGSSSSSGASLHCWSLCEATCVDYSFRTSVNPESAFIITPGAKLAGSAGFSPFYWQKF